MNLCIDCFNLDTVIGIDNMNNYYDVNLKKRLKIEKFSNFKFVKVDIKKKEF